MAATAEMTAPPRFEWKRWPETDAFVDEAIAVALAGNALRPRWRAGCRARRARGSRSGSITWCCEADRGARAAAWSSWATSGSR